jgi:hypothetical protein
MTLYPNPVKANSMLTLRTASGRDGLHVFQLVTVTGQIVYKKELILNKSDKLVQLQIPDLIAGNYFLTMTDNKSAKPLTEKIIIINH